MLFDFFLGVCFDFSFAFLTFFELWQLWSMVDFFGVVLILFDVVV